MNESLPQKVVRSAWIFMLGLTMCFAWPMAVLIGGPSGVRGFAHLLGIATTRHANAAGWVLAVAVAAIFIAATMRSYPLIRRHVFDRSRPSLKLLAVLFGVVAAIVEEVWFRQLPMDWAATHGVGGAGQVLLSAVAFALPHAIWGVAARSRTVLLGSVAATGLLGASLAVVYLAANRVVAPCIWAHAALNIVLEPWLFIAAMVRGIERRSHVAGHADETATLPVHP